MKLKHILLSSKYSGSYDFLKEDEDNVSDDGFEEEKDNWKLWKIKYTNDKWPTNWYDDEKKRSKTDEGTLPTTKTPISRAQSALQLQNLRSRLFPTGKEKIFLTTFRQRSHSLSSSILGGWEEEDERFSTVTSRQDITSICQDVVSLSVSVTKCMLLLLSRCQEELSFLSVSFRDHS